MGHCFTQVVVVTKQKVKTFFLTFLNWEKTDIVLGKKDGFFSIGNGGEIRPLEKGRKCSDRLNTITKTSTNKVCIPIAF